MFGQVACSAIGPFVRSTNTLLGYGPERATRREESEGEGTERKWGVPPGVWTQDLTNIPALVLPKTVLDMDPTKRYS